MNLKIILLFTIFVVSAEAKEMKEIEKVCEKYSTMALNLFKDQISEFDADPRSPAYSSGTWVVQLMGCSLPYSLHGNSQKAEDLTRFSSEVVDVSVSIAIKQGEMTDESLYDPEASKQIVDTAITYIGKLNREAFIKLYLYYLASVVNDEIEKGKNFGNVDELRRNLTVKAEKFSSMVFDNWYIDIKKRYYTN